MVTIEEHNEVVLHGNNIHAALESQSKDWFSDAKKYVEFSLQVMLILGKYFFKDGKISVPKLIFFWKYFGLVSELYNLFINFNKKD